jgi:transposase
LAPSLRLWSGDEGDEGAITPDPNKSQNYLFVGSDAGGQRAAIIYTIAETAKLNGLDPEAYIAAVLERLAKGHPINRLDDLLPWKLRP